jgi:thioredoxin reductase (NADPH)
VVIIGAGPAGLAAAIYAARAGLRPVLIAPDIGGALTYTKEVENYPGSLDLTGEHLIETLRIQAESFDTQFESTVVKEVNLSMRPFTIVTNATDDNVIRSHTLIIATGANSVWLGVAGEEEYRARGITTCATCDGYLFKGKPVLVVGGGDTAMEEALFMARIASKVTLIHRRDDFRASYIMQQRVRNHNHIEIIWNSQVTQFGGDGEGLTHAIVENKVTKEVSTINIAAAFVAIGHTPNTVLFKGQLGMDQTGYLMTTAGRTHTTVEGVFACGDVADSHYRQAVTSAATGAMAAIDAEHYLDEQGIDVGDGHTEPGDTDYMSWTIAKLKTALKEKGISHRGCVEKGDFIRKLTGQTL